MSDNPNAFKLVFSQALIVNTANIISQHDPHFNLDGFIATASRELDKLELKARSNQIASAFEVYLTSDMYVLNKLFEKVLAPEQLTDALNFHDNHQAGLQGWIIMPLAEFVTRVGMQAPEPALALLRMLTKRFSSEFAIRPFLINHTDLTLSILQTWLKDENPHVRRLISEGARPRLPWGMQIPAFIENPHLTLPLLDALKNDASAYVRKSVANHLNDISKDHPECVVEVTRGWLNGADQNLQRLIKHGCRTLIKQGHPDALSLLGFESLKLSVVNLLLNKQTVKLGEPMVLSLKIKSAVKVQRFVIDIVFYFLKANGTFAPKVFKWTHSSLTANELLILEKEITLKTVTTRKYYSGLQRVGVQINGQKYGDEVFDLIV